jgi:hypothetical protein
MGEWNNRRQWNMAVGRRRLAFKTAKKKGFGIILIAGILFLSIELKNYEILLPFPPLILFFHLHTSFMYHYILCIQYARKKIICFFSVSVFCVG